MGVLCFVSATRFFLTGVPIFGIGNGFTPSDRNDPDGNPDGLLPRDGV